VPPSVIIDGFRLMPGFDVLPAAAPNDDPPGANCIELHCNPYLTGLRQLSGGGLRDRNRRSLKMTAERPTPAGQHAAHGADAGLSRSRVPICFVVDEEGSIRHFLSLIMHGAGMDTVEFADGPSMAQAVAKHNPDLIFLNIDLESSEAIKTILMLAKRGSFAFVQLMSSRGSAVLEHVKSVGDQHKLQMLPVLKKPFQTSAVVRIIQELKLGLPAPAAARVGLDDALRKRWIEFWYQPKIDLRKKQLAGVEAFARARHPQFGVLSPNAFMPGATEAELVGLSELALGSALQAAGRFSKLGINLQVAVNVPVNALVKLSVGDIVRANRPSISNWAGLVIDVTEEQIVTNLALAADMAKNLARHNVRLAIDNFGRGYSSLARLKELPFSELKLDRTFVTDCGTDKVNAPLCKTVIDLAHNFGSAAVAIGIEKAADALALTSMGCDVGQGFLLGQPMPEERFMSLLRQRAGSQSRPDKAAAAAR
jgi:EAL domain-containing protein (putative c-di-GMP-specific phosphodiesterase class I)